MTASNSVDVPLPGILFERKQPFSAIGQTVRRYNTEHVNAALIQHKETLLREMQHRVGNSLQIIASILALDARKVHSVEARLHLENAHRRILAVASVQQQLQTSREGGTIEVATYLRQLCDNLTASVVGNPSQIAIAVHADGGTVSSTVAVNMGLIVTELVINAIKHAFPDDTATGQILVTYRVEGYGWTLAVSDNGAGKQNGEKKAAVAGVGTSILAGLVGQLNARLECSTAGGGVGTCVSITPSKAQLLTPAPN